MATKRTRGRPKMPAAQAARVRAGLAVLLKTHGTGEAVAYALAADHACPVSRVTVNAVARCDTGPSMMLAGGVARALGYDVDKFLVMPLSEIRGAS